MLQSICLSVCLN